MKAFIKDLWFHRDNEIQSLNGLRAFAIILVILNHYALAWKKIGTLQSDSLFWSGVDLSFVLSGFLISKGLLNDWNRNGTIDFQKFYLKRTFRIFPAYYFFITFSLIASNFVLKIAEKKGLEKEVDVLSFKLSNAWGDFVFLGNYFPGMNIHTWSLSMEEQFYLIFPLFCGLLLFKIGPKRRQLFLWCLLLIPTASRVIVYVTTAAPLTPEYFNEIYFPFHTRFDSLVMGVIAMDLYTGHKDLVDRLKSDNRLYYPLLLLFFSFLCAAHWVNLRTDSFFTHTFKYNLLNISFAGILLFVVVRSESFLSRFLSLKLFVPVARLSFTIYLWHLILIGISLSILKIRTEPSSTLALLSQFIFVLVLVVILSIPFYALIEYPFQYLKMKILLKKKSDDRSFQIQSKSSTC
ncbi:acyltransferase family protein [Leptospira santarosai]|nr:acyltransferase [Leptospira santarosai]AIT10761.1 acetyltransferase [Leptospira santarosai serovar Shermani str. LT 821]EKO34209.1 acyltransferase [Leptospira santarosai str. MOR084]EMM84929.1 acyltransferase [Leptospira santarosai str. 2000027870]EMO12895.1 acyltransferase [Leptospira santarosai str. CBC523]